MKVYEAGQQPPSPEPCERCKRMRDELVMKMLMRADEPTQHPPWRCPACGRRWAVVPSEHDDRADKQDRA